MATTEPGMDAVFKALADPSRRKILDLLKTNPATSVTGLTAHFEYSRFALMKHLRILERANMVVSVRSGRSRLLYLNAVPIQFIYDRWISSYSSLWATSLTRLKYGLEKEETMSNEPPKQVYVVYIKTRPDLLWDALCDPKKTEVYFHGTNVQSDFQTGSDISYLLKEDGKPRTVVTGKIIEVDPKKRLVHTFAFTSENDKPTRVTYLIEELGEVVKLTVTHDHFEAETTTYKDTREGWPPILSGLKTYLETGESLGLIED